MEIMNAGGGIHATTKMTREATEEELVEQAKKRLDSFLKHGVTTVEGKSGYGLDLGNGTETTSCHETIAGRTCD